MLFTAWKMGVCPPRPSASRSARAFTSAPAVSRTRAQRVELNSAHTCRAETPRQEVKAHRGLSFRCRFSLDLARSARSFWSSSSRTASSSGSPSSAPTSSMTCKHSENREDRRYISINVSIGRLPLIGSVGLTPAARTARIPAGECSSNSPDRSASVAKAPPLAIIAASTQPEQCVGRQIVRHGYSRLVAQPLPILWLWPDARNPDALHMGSEDSNLNASDLALSRIRALNGINAMRIGSPGRIRIREPSANADSAYFDLI